MLLESLDSNESDKQIYEMYKALKTVKGLVQNRCKEALINIHDCEKEAKTKVKIAFAEYKTLIQ
jgi:hypothetical protein